MTHRGRLDCAPCAHEDERMRLPHATTRQSALLLGLVSVLLAAAPGGSAAPTGHAVTNPGRVVAITATEPARLVLLDARTLRPARPGWSLTLPSRSPTNPAALSPVGSGVAVVVGGESSQSLLIVDTAGGQVLRRVREINAAELYWLGGEGKSRRSPAFVVTAVFACYSGGVPNGVCGDEVDVAWTSDRRGYPGGTIISDRFFVDVDHALRTRLVLTADNPQGIVLQPRPPGDSSIKHYIELAGMPNDAGFEIATDALNDRVFVVTTAGQIARISRASGAKPVVDYHSVALSGRAFKAAWAGAGRIALWGADGLGTIDTRTWTTHAIAPGVSGAVATRYGIAAWTGGPDGLNVYRPDGSRRLRLFEGTQVTAARAIGAYLYVDSTLKTRYAVDLRTGKSVGPLKSSAQIVGPSFVTIP
jgi:hypothetical protein